MRVDSGEVYFTGCFGGAHFHGGTARIITKRREIGEIDLDDVRFVDGFRGSRASGGSSGTRGSGGSSGSSGSGGSRASGGSSGSSGDDDFFRIYQGILRRY